MSTTTATTATKYAIVDLNGKQYRVEEGRYSEFDLLPVDEEGTLELSNVLLISDNGKVTIGAPYIAGASVSLRVLRHDKKKKVLVYKMRCKKGYRLKNGHRQPYSKAQVEAIRFA